MISKVKFNSYISRETICLHGELEQKNTFARKCGAKNAVINST